MAGADGPRDLADSNRRRDSLLPVEDGVDSKEQELSSISSEELLASLYPSHEVTTKPISDRILESGLGAGLLVPINLPPTTNYDTSPYPSSSSATQVSKTTDLPRPWEATRGDLEEQFLFCPSHPGYIVRLPGTIEKKFSQWKLPQSKIRPTALEFHPRMQVYPTSLQWTKDMRTSG